MPTPSAISTSSSAGQNVGSVGISDFTLDSFSKTWRKNLSQASFRGVAFKVMSSETQVGRNIKTQPLYTQARNAETVLASRFVRRATVDRGFGQTSVGTRRVEGIEDQAAIIADVGRLPEKFTIEGYVIQNSENSYDYFAERDALIKALNTFGTGRLVHPWYGELDVHLVEAAKIEESFKEGGIARFKMTFIEATIGIGLEDIVADWHFRITSLSELLSALGLDSINTLLSGVYDVVNAVKMMKTALQKIVNGINSIKGAISSVIAEATGFVSGIIDMVDTIIDAPCDIAKAVMDGVGAFKNVGGLGSQVISGGVIGGCSGVTTSNYDQYNLDGESIPPALGIAIIKAMTDVTDYSAEDQGQTNSDDGDTFQTGLSNALKYFIFMLIPQITIKINFGNRQELIDLIALVTDAMDDFLDELGRQKAKMKNDDLFNGMQQIRSEFILGMTEQGKNLIRLVTYTTTQDPPPIIVLAYNWYEDIYRDQEIITLNDPIIRHPGFPPQGVDIRLLEF